MTKVLNVLILSLFVILFVHAPAAADCWKNIQKGQHSQELECRLLEWKADPGNRNTNLLLKSLFFTYLTDGHNSAMKSFFNSLRENDSAFASMQTHARNLISKYTFDDWEANESAAIWTMQPQDARALFILSQTKPGSLPHEIEIAVHLAVYDQIDQYFYLKSAYEDSFAVLPLPEYERLLEILKRMANFQDPFLTAVNLFYRGIVNLNLGLKSDGFANLTSSRNILNRILPEAREIVARKRILGIHASASILLGNLSDAESDYVTILKIDPHDWNTLMELSYLLNRRGECVEPGVWIEAYLKKGNDQYDIVLHCGNQEYPDVWFDNSSPVIADLR